MNKVFISTRNFEEAKFRAKMAGFTIVGQARNKQGYYVVFGRR